MAGRRAVLQKLVTLERSVSRAYVSAIQNKKIIISELEALINKNDFEGVVIALEIEQDDVSAVIEELRNSVIQGAELEKTRSAKSINPNTEKTALWLQEKSGALITAINEGTRASVTEILAANALSGLGARATALDIVGRVDARGNRTGGVIGLNNQQAMAALNARENLASGDPEKMRKYLQNERRDKRFDAQVKRAINGKAALTSGDIDKITSRYQARLLQTRGETIARTETSQALNHGRMTQVGKNAGNANAIIMKRWVSGPDDGRQRHSHTEANGQIREISQPFDVGGYQLMEPGDSSLGAPAEEIINCRCTVAFEMVKETEES